jgi:hypothetical protein
MYTVLQLRIILIIIFLPHLIFLQFGTLKEVSSNGLHLMSLSIQFILCNLQKLRATLASRTGASNSRRPAGPKKNHDKEYTQKSNRIPRNQKLTEEKGMKKRKEHD